MASHQVSGNPGVVGQSCHCEIAAQVRGNGEEAEPGKDDEAAPLHEVVMYDQSREVKAEHE
jgi:hypothetical protein